MNIKFYTFVLSFFFILLFFFFSFFIIIITKTANGNDSNYPGLIKENNTVRF